MSKNQSNLFTTLLVSAGALFLFKKKQSKVAGIGATSSFSMGRLSGYGQYYIEKTTPGGKTTKVRTTDSQLFDDYQDGKVSQARLKRVYDFYSESNFYR